ncbi:MAG: glycosyltransferase family 2 protein [bacterium]|nr:glycosyltransferase family 2 protein [bacterium]
MLISIIIPAFNEAGSIEDTIRAVAGLPFEKEILAVDDGSRDGTGMLVRRLEKEIKELRGLYFPENRGKGFAIQAGTRAARGEIVVIQDADREYLPDRITSMVEELSRNQDIAAVFGSRKLKKNPASYRRYYWGGRFLTWLVNRAGKGSLTDVTTGHKAIRWKILESLQLQANGFEIEMEIVMKLLRRGFQIKEIPTDYSPRSFEEGKKIRWIDGLKSIWAILKFRKY